MDLGLKILGSNDRPICGMTIIERDKLAKVERIWRRLAKRRFSYEVGTKRQLLGKLFFFSFLFSFISFFPFLFFFFF